MLKELFGIFHPALCKRRAVEYAPELLPTPIPCLVTDARPEDPDASYPDIILTLAAPFHFPIGAVKFRER